jgi:hypothetical protein
MKKIFTSLFVLATMCLGMNAFAIFPQDTKNQALYTLAQNRDPLPGIGYIINQTKNMMRVTYDATVLALTGSVTLNDDQGNQAYLPKGAIVTNVVANVLTAPLPSTSSIALQLLTAGDLMATKAQASLTGFVAGVPVGTAATWVGPVTAQIGSQPTAVLSGSTLTAGKIEWFIEYVIQ